MSQADWRTEGRMDGRGLHIQGPFSHPAYKLKVMSRLDKASATISIGIIFLKVTFDQTGYMKFFTRGYNRRNNSQENFSARQHNATSPIHVN
jgi:hypothetical protein